MPNEITSSMTSPFDRIRHTDEFGEYWLAREFGPAMGYRGRDAWRNTLAVVEKVKAMAVTLGQSPSDLVADVNNQIPRGKGARPQTIADFRMTRRACSLFVLCADERKVEVAAGKHYFAVKTREAEIGPRPQIIVRRNPWADRFKETGMAHMVYVRKHYKAGDWTIILAKLPEFLTLEDVLLEHAFELCSGDRPDVSVGLCWAKWIHDQPPIGEAPLYLPDRKITVRVKVYPACVRQDFDVWWESNYIFDKMRSYLQGKFKKRYGELAADSATHHFSIATTGRTCPKIPAKNLRAIEYNGGMVKAGQIVGLPSQQIALPLGDK